MKRKALSCLSLILAAVACHFCLRYLFGEFQGYLTIPVGGTGYGFAHIKGGTVWVSDRQFTHLPGVAPAAALASIIALAFAVRHTYRSIFPRRINVV